MALVEAKVEGPINDIVSDGAGGAVITALGAGAATRVTILYSPGPVIVVPAAVPPAPLRQKSIRSPSQRLTVDELISLTPLPGRSPQEGFKGGTIIAEGFYSTDTLNGVNVFLANHVFVEPAETVLIGAVTGNNGTTIQVNTVDVVPLTDARISTNPANRLVPIYLNDSGFEITLASITLTPTTPNLPAPATPPAPTAVEGYYAGGQMFAHLIEFGGPGLLAPLAEPALPIDFPRISIERAQVRDLGTSFDIEVRGHITVPPPLPLIDHVIEIRVRDMKVGTFGTQDADWEYRGGSDATADITGADTNGIDVDLRSTGGVPITLVPPIQRWRFRGNLPKTGVHLLPPERIEARNVTAEGLITGNFPAPANSHVRVEVDTDVRDE